MKQLLLVLSLIFCANAFAETQFNVEDEISIAISEHSDDALNEDKSVDYRSYYFGQVPVGYRRSVNYTVTNIGHTPLSFQNTYTWGSGYQSYHGCYGTLYPRQRCQFTIMFSPHFQGYFTGGFEILFYPYSVVRVNLSGYGVRNY